MRRSSPSGRQVKEQSYVAPYTVKRLLTKSAIPADSDLGAFVGIAAYEAAGGTVTRDLFSAETDGEVLYFYAEESPAVMPVVSRAELAAALAESEAFASSLNAYVAERLPCFPVDEDTIVLDLSGMSWKFIFQDIVRRSKSLRYITAVFVLHLLEDAV
jgi:hypothetical protein